MSPLDYKEQRLSRNEARKQISKIVSDNPGNIRFSKHAVEELENDDLTTADALRSPDDDLLNVRQ